VLAGACGAACAVTLAGCAGYVGVTPDSEAPGGATGGSGATTGPRGGAGAVLARTSEIEPGGGRIFGEQKVVVTQPTAGQFKAFSSTCTHQGCQVAAVEGGTINCNCHGSKFAVADGSVVDGPAGRPLPARQITVSNGTISLA